MSWDSALLRLLGHQGTDNSIDPFELAGILGEARQGTMEKSVYDLTDNGIVTASAIQAFEALAVTSVSQGQVVTIIGFEAQQLLPLARVVNRTELPEFVAVGISTENVTAGQKFAVITRGIAQFDTSMWQAEQFLYTGDDGFLTTSVNTTVNHQTAGQVISSGVSGFAMIELGFSTASITPERLVPTIYPFIFDSSTTPPPSIADVMMNSTNPAAATTLYFHVYDRQLQDRRERYKQLAANDIVNYRSEDLLNDYQFTVTGPAIDSGDYFSVPVTNFSVTGSLSQGQNIDLVLQIAAMT